MNPDTAKKILKLVEDVLERNESDPVGAQRATDRACDLISECWEDAEGDPVRRAAIKRFDRWARLNAL